MYAIIETGGKQYTVRPGDELRIEKLDAEAGNQVTFEQVLLVGGEGDTKVGHPFVEGAKVTAEVLNHGRAKKVMIYKFKRRKNYRRLRGHRQQFTQVRIQTIAA